MCVGCDQSCNLDASWLQFISSVNRLHAVWDEAGLWCQVISAPHTWWFKNSSTVFFLSFFLFLCEKYSSKKANTIMAWILAVETSFILFVLFFVYFSRRLMVEKLTFSSRATALVDIPAVSMPIAWSLKTVWHIRVAFIVASLRHTCAIIMLSNQHLDMPHLWGGWIISAKCSLTRI